MSSPPPRKKAREDSGKVIDWSAQIVNYSRLYKRAIEWSRKIHAEGIGDFSPDALAVWKIENFFTEEEKRERGIRKYAKEIKDDDLEVAAILYDMMDDAEKAKYKPHGLFAAKLARAVTPTPRLYYGKFQENSFFMEFKIEDDYIYWANRSLKTQIGPLLLGVLHHSRHDPWMENPAADTSAQGFFEALTSFNPKYMRIEKSTYNIIVATKFLTFLQSEAHRAYTERIVYTANLNPKIDPGDVITWDTCPESTERDARNKERYRELTLVFDKIRERGERPLDYYQLTLQPDVYMGNTRKTFFFFVQAASQACVNTILYKIAPNGYTIPEIEYPLYDPHIIFGTIADSPSWAKFIAPSVICKTSNTLKKEAPPKDADTLPVTELFDWEYNDRKVYLGTPTESKFHINIDGTFANRAHEKPGPEAGIATINNHVTCLFTVNGTNWYMADPWKSPENAFEEDAYPMKILERWFTKIGKTFEHLNVEMAQHSKEGSCGAVALMRCFIAANELEKREGGGGGDPQIVKDAVTGKTKNWPHENACFALLAFRLMHIYRTVTLKTPAKKVVRTLEQIFYTHTKKSLEEKPHTLAQIEAMFGGLIKGDKDRSTLKTVVSMLADETKRGDETVYTLKKPKFYRVSSKR